MTLTSLNITFRAILACLLWSSAFVGIKIGLPYTTPIQFAGIRFFISGLLVLPVAWYYNRRLLGAFKKHIGFILLMGFLQTFIQYALFYTGISKVPGATGAIVIGSGPLFIAIVAHFFMPGDRISASKVVPILLGIGGIALVSIGRNGTQNAQFQLIGVIILVGNNIISGFSNVIVARENRDIPPLVLSSGSMIVGGALLMLFSIPIEGVHFGPKPPEYYLSLGWLSMLSAVAISIWITLLKVPGVVVSNLNIWKFLIPVSGAVLAWLILPAESPDMLSIVGMLVTGLSLVLLNRMKVKSTE